MQVLVISDIHGNLVALQAVLEDAERNSPSARPYDAVWCLGDLVGYGPDPNECVERVRSLPGLVCLIGNHDLAVLGQIPLSRFNQDAHDALAWTTNTLSPEHRDFLASLPPLVIKEPFTLAHGSPRQPVWEYILDRYTAERNFDEMTTDYALVGHSHLPLMLRRAGEDAEVVPLPLGWAQPTALTPKMILNPGSVGQPRDLDPRAAYAILDLEAQTWEPRRVDYAIDRVQSRMVELGLPQRLALRLAAGM